MQGARNKGRSSRQAAPPSRGGRFTPAPKPAAGPVTVGGTSKRRTRADIPTSYTKPKTRRGK